jgi:AcrR family transcriptional regulator
MQQRDEEEYEAKRQNIINGALEVFAHKGFEKATNKDIAKASGITSPGLIYHYFQDKAHLYREVLEQRIPLLQLLLHSKELEGLPPEDALTRFGRAYLQMLESPQAVTFLRLVLSDSTRYPHVAQLFWKAGPTRALTFLANYLEGEMEAGRLRRVDPQLAVMQFMGPMVMYVLSRCIFGGSPGATVDAATLLQNNVETFLRAMRPTSVLSDAE